MLPVLNCAIKPMLFAIIDVESTLESLFIFSQASLFLFSGQICVEVFIKTAVDCKMEGIDWITTYGRDPKDLKKMSHDAGLEIACHTFFAHFFLTGEENWLDDIKQSIEDAVVLGAPVVMIPTCSKADMDRDTFRDMWIKGLKQIAPLTDDAGLILTVENFPGISSAFITADDYYGSSSVKTNL